MIRDKNPAMIAGSSGPIKIATIKYGIMKESHANIAKGIVSEIFLNLSFFSRLKTTKATRIIGIIKLAMLWIIAVFFVISSNTSFSNPKPPSPNKIGVPAAPKLTGVELAINERTIANSGVNPIETNRGAANAAGVPNPAIPSINAPNKKAIIIAWILASSEINAKLDCRFFI